MFEHCAFDLVSLGGLRVLTRRHLNTDYFTDCYGSSRYLRTYIHVLDVLDITPKITSFAIHTSSVTLQIIQNMQYPMRIAVCWLGS
jgi:hypothetical protein